MIRRLFARIVKTRENREADRWLPSLAGCCSCGTGGPYYRGRQPQVTRYLYVGATVTGNVPDWSSCSRHPLKGLTPVVDYGSDVEVTFARTEADCRAALESRRVRDALLDIAEVARQGADRIDRAGGTP